MVSVSDWSLGVFQKAILKVLVRAAVISWLNQGRICFQSHSCGSWQASEDRLPSLLTEATPPNCLTTWQLASSRISDQERVREITQHGSHSPFHNLILEMTSYHSLLYSIHLMQRFSALTPLTFWVGLFLAVRAVLCIIER